MCSPFANIDEISCHDQSITFIRAIPIVVVLVRDLAEAVLQIKGLGSLVG